MAVTAPLNRTVEMVIGLFVDICISLSVGMLTGRADYLMPPVQRRMCEIALRRHEKEMPGPAKLKGRSITGCGQDSDACSINWRSRLVSVSTSAPR
jgi:hypothetical protein